CLPSQSRTLVVVRGGGGVGSTPDGELAAPVLCSLSHGESRWLVVLALDVFLCSVCWCALAVAMLASLICAYSSQSQRVWVLVLEL
ncbi:hypothetical protein Taro_010700, partial [Colocasia esculenta]|nr:hypothetical protein [Colocasia esculenta]